MTDKDFKLIEAFLNDKLSLEELETLNQKMEDETFREEYLNYVMDDRLITKALQNEGKRKRHSKSIVSFLVAVAALFIIVFNLLDFTGSSNKEIFITHSSTDAIIKRQNKSLKVNSQIELIPGDRLKTSSQTISFSYKDGTAITVHPNSELEIIADKKRKKVFIHHGEITADVTPQGKEREMVLSTPNSKAYVLGTIFTIKAAKGVSTLDVIEGKVRFHNKSGSDDLVVAGEYAQAKKNEPVIAQAKDPFPADRMKALQRFNTWRKYSEKLKNDPSVLVYYDFEKITHEKHGMFLKNKAVHTADLNLDGEIVTTRRIRGRWYTKEALYFSHYGHVAFKESPIYNIDSPMTVFVWFRVKKFRRKWQTIVSKGDDAWRIARHKKYNHLQFVCNGLEPNQLLEGKKSVYDNKWHMVAVTYDGKEMSMYIDGVLDQKQSASGNININNSPLQIGSNSSRSGRDFEGWIDELAIFQRALSPEEIREIYEVGKP